MTFNLFQSSLLCSLIDVMFKFKKKIGNMKMIRNLDAETQNRAHK